MLHRVVVATAGVPNAHHDVMDADCLREAATERGDFEFDESTQQLIAYVEDGSDIPVADSPGRPGRGVST